LENLSLNPYREGHRVQELAFQLARDLARDYAAQSRCAASMPALFPQLLSIARRYLTEKILALAPAEPLDAFLSPYYGWIIERLVGAIKPDVTSGEAPELPRYEPNRGPGSTADVDYWTGKDVREVLKSHVNYVVADTRRWEQSAAYTIERHPAVHAFVKNSGLGFAIPYFANGQDHDYIPDFLIRLRSGTIRHVILETKGFDENADIKVQAAHRWVSAVNADGTFGIWRYAIARRLEEVPKLLDEAAGS